MIYSYVDLAVVGCIAQLCRWFTSSYAPPCYSYGECIPSHSKLSGYPLVWLLTGHVVC